MGMSLRDTVMDKPWTGFARPQLDHTCPQRAVVRLVNITTMFEKVSQVGHSGALLQQLTQKGLQLVGLLRRQGAVGHLDHEVGRRACD